MRKPPKYYYANEDKSIIYLDKEYIDEDFKKYKDIQFQPPINNLFDPISKYLLEFKTRNKQVSDMNFLEIYNIRTVEAEPLLIGENSQEILNLYSGVETIEHCIEHFKEDLVNRNKNLNYVFGEESKVVYWKQHLKESRIKIEPVESFFED